MTLGWGLPEGADFPEARDRLVMSARVQAVGGEARLLLLGRGSPGLAVLPGSSCGAVGGCRGRRGLSAPGSCPGLSSASSPGALLSPDGHPHTPMSTWRLASREWGPRWEKGTLLVAEPPPAAPSAGVQASPWWGGRPERFPRLISQRHFLASQAIGGRWEGGDRGTMGCVVLCRLAGDSVILEALGAGSEGWTIALCRELGTDCWAGRAPKVATASPVAPCFLCLLSCFHEPSVEEAVPTRGGGQSPSSSAHPRVQGTGAPGAVPMPCQSLCPGCGTLS